MIYEWTDGIPVSLQPKYSETAMTIDLYINEANDYARDIGAPVLHPHVCVIHYDEVGEIRHTLNRTNCYGIFLQEEFPEGLTYGIGTYHDGDGSLLAFSPGQIGGRAERTLAEFLPCKRAELEREALYYDMTTKSYINDN